MKKDAVYQNEKTDKLIAFAVIQIIMYGVALYFTIIGLSDFGDTVLLIAVGVEVLIFAVVFFGWVGLSIRPVQKFCSWMHHMKRYGTEYAGKTTKTIKKVSEDIYGDEFKTEYRFKVQYFNTRKGEYQEFTTPVLAFEPEADTMYHCRVYVVEKTPKWAVYDLGHDPFEEVKKAERVRARRAYGRWKKKYNKREFEYEKKQKLKNPNYQVTKPGKKSYANTDEERFLLKLIYAAYDYGKLNWFGNALATEFVQVGADVTE